MKKRTLQLLLTTTLLCSAGTLPAMQEESQPITTQTTGSPQLWWEQGKQLTDKAWEAGKSAGSTIVDGSRSLYQSGKEKGAVLGSRIGEVGASAWQRTREFARSAYEGGKRLGDRAIEGTRSLYRKAMESGQITPSKDQKTTKKGI